MAKATGKDAQDVTKVMLEGVDGDVLGMQWVKRNLNTQQLVGSSFRPKLGLLAAAIALGVLSFMTFFSVELTSLQLMGVINPSDRR